MRNSVRDRWPALAALALAAVLLPALPSSADAQYFGRNKVQYENFDFRVLETEHFDLYHYEEERNVAVMTARMAERWYARLSRLLDYELTGRQPFILYASHPHFEQTTAIPGEIGEATGGVTEPLKRRIVLPAAGPLAETDHVTGHELVHGFQYSMTGIDPRSPLAGAPAISRQPLFLIEGMAEYLSTGSRSVLTARWMRDELIRDDRRFPTVGDLQNSRKFFPYRYGHSLWAFVGGTWGDDAVREIFLQSVRSSPSAAIRSVLGVAPDTLSAAWRRALEDAYRPVLERTSDPSEFGDPIITEESAGGTINLGPSLSPDGDRVVFLSERGRFSIEMYVADAETGEVLRQLTSTAVDPHFQSLQFINSAGAWAPDSERFAFAAVSAGQPLLVVMNARTGKKLRELKFPRFGEIFNPTWSPSGDRVAFVANEHGTLDLFIADLESGELQRLTDDEYAEVHPAWSPGGDRIAFATDRFGTSLGTLSYGDYRLASVDLSTGEVSRLPSFEGARNTNPQWGPDGESLYFLSDRGGIPNLYRGDLGTGDAVPLTNVNTGVAGITELSPALAVARSSGRIVFGAYRQGDYNLYRMDEPRAVPPEDRLDPAGRDRVATLPPLERSDEERVDRLLADATLGLPSPVTFRSHDYRPSLSLDYIAQPSLFAGASSASGFVLGGGAALFFSDMLGQHALTNVLQLSIIEGEVLNGIGALAQYENRDNRLRWGGIVGQMPQITQRAGQGLVDRDGDGTPEVLLQTLTFWQVDRQAVGVLSYPFGNSLRAELTGGFRRIDFELEVREEIFSLAGRRLDETTTEVRPCGDSLSLEQTLCEPGSLNQGVTSLALVHDASLSGPTGPILGSRGRLEVSPTFGSLDYLTALGDLRKYVMPFEPLTLAGRALHLGRYGSDADDPRLTDLFIGYSSLVRGYSFGSFDLRNCPLGPGTSLEDCSEFTTLQQLFGTRMAVGNVEARLPLSGPLGVLGRSAVVPPIDLIGFFDAGVAWTADSEASFLGGDRDLVRSAGVGLRINLLGFAVGELHWVNPFDRPDKDPFINFTLNSAF